MEESVKYSGILLHVEDNRQIFTTGLPLPLSNFVHLSHNVVSQPVELMHVGNLFVFGQEQ